MTEAKTFKLIDHHVSEFLDGYVVLGFSRQNEVPVIVVNSKNLKTCMALNALLASVISNGGVAVTKEDD